MPEIGSSSCALRDKVGARFAIQYVIHRVTRSARNVACGLPVSGQKTRHGSNTNSWARACSTAGAEKGQTKVNPSYQAFH